jgi:nanoRNase/pAp phosphatase (c-di-AMP/oligoRNAs hydrolase)
MHKQPWDIAPSQAKIAELSSIVEGSSQKGLLILCHNNPDPDALASAFGFSYLLQKKFNMRCVMGYGGVMTRAENKAMVNRLRIPVKRLLYEDLSQYSAVALIDAQPISTQTHKRNTLNQHSHQIEGDLMPNIGQRGYLLQFSLPLSPSF